jgi:hypothetical protein
MQSSTGHYEVHLFYLIVALYSPILFEILSTPAYTLSKKKKKNIYIYMYIKEEESFSRLTTAIGDNTGVSLIVLRSPFSDIFILYTTLSNHRLLAPHVIQAQPCIPPPVPVIQAQPCIPPPVADIQNTAIAVPDPTTPSRKRPARIPGFTGSNAAFLVPDHIRKKFADGWNVHIPLTYLTDRGCLMKDKPIIGSTQDILTIDNATGLISTTSKPLADEGELDLSFDEWHQAWRRLLDLIKSFIPEDFTAWEKHYLSILNNDNRAESWPLFLAYDAEIRKRTTQFPIDPSVFSVGVWNDLEARYMTRRVVSLVQSDLKLQLAQHGSRNSNRNSSFRDQQRSTSDNPKSGRCIFCGDLSKEHMSRNCSASCNIKGSPCYVFKHGQSSARRCKAGKSYCYAWNGPSGCDQGSSCRRGEHWCTLCGSKAHNAQKCDIVS